MHTEKIALKLSGSRSAKQLGQGVELSGQAAFAARAAFQINLVDVFVQAFEILLQRHQRDLLCQVRV